MGKLKILQNLLRMFPYEGLPSYRFRRHPLRLLPNRRNGEADAFARLLQGRRQDHGLPHPKGAPRVQARAPDHPFVQESGGRIRILNPVFREPHEQARPPAHRGGRGRLLQDGPRDFPRGQEAPIPLRPDRDEGIQPQKDRVRERGIRALRRAGGESPEQGEIPGERIREIPRVLRHPAESL